MTNELADLDQLVGRVRDPNSRRYVQDALRAHRAGAQRPAIDAAWVAVAYDLVVKNRELSVAGDRVALAWIQKWDGARGRGDTRQLLNLERGLLDHAADQLQLLDPLAKRDLDRLREDRHLCAHPAFADEATLFDPPPDLVRVHIRNAIDLLLALPPRQGQTLIAGLVADLLSPGFPIDPARLPDYFEDRYLARARPSVVGNIVVVLAKSLLRGVPPELEDRADRVAGALKAMRDRRRAEWPDLRLRIIHLIEDLEPDLRPRAVGTLGVLPELWTDLSEAMRTALVETITNTDPNAVVDLRLLRGAAVPELREATVALVKQMSDSSLSAALRDGAEPELWPVALDRYRQSQSFRGSEALFQELISPFGGVATASQVEALLNAIVENGQNHSANGTPRLLADFLENTLERDRPSARVRDEFVHALDARGPSRSRGQFEELCEALSWDEWEPPANLKTTSLDDDDT